MTVQVSDMGLPTLSDSASVIITIQPPSSKPPEFIDKCPGTRYIDEVSVAECVDVLLLVMGQD